MRCRVSYLLRFYLLTVLVFIAAKVVFMLAYHSEHHFLVGDVFDVVRHGLSLDLSTALYFLIVPFLLTIVSIWVRVPRWLFCVYYAFIAVAFALAVVADTSLYGFWQFKLDASCLQYLESPTEATASVSTGYLLLRVVAVVVIAALIYGLYRLNGHCGQSRLTNNHPSVLPRLLETALYAILLPLIIIGIRGGLGESTTNIGQVYFSQNQFLNHSAVNPVFSFLSSLSKSGDYIVCYDYYTDDECTSLTDSLYNTTSDQPDTLLNTTRPNIVIILMESCGGQFTELGGHLEITPRLNALTQEAIYFTECYANSWRTDKGVVSTLSGYPAFPITSVMKIPEKSRLLPSIAKSLAAENYTTAFYYGGDINFTNMRSYLMGTGYQQLRWKADYSRSYQTTAQWGVRDDLMFNSLLEDIKSEKSNHWMKTLLTLSSHEPWDVPSSDLDDEVYNAFHYLDRCVGTFIDSLRQTPLWKDLLIVLLPDHGLRYQGVDETTRLYNHIPMLWVGGAVSEPRRINHLCNQSDLAATLLGQLGLPHDDYTFSRDILSRNYHRPMASHTYNNGVTLYDTTGFVAYDLDAARVIAHEGSDTTRLLRQARALLQLTSKDLAHSLTTAKKKTTKAPFESKK